MTAARRAEVNAGRKRTRGERKARETAHDANIARHKAPGAIIRRKLAHTTPPAPQARRIRASGLGGFCHFWGGHLPRRSASGRGTGPHMHRRGMGAFLCPSVATRPRPPGRAS